MTEQLSTPNEQSLPKCMPDIADMMAAFDAAGGDAEAIDWLADNDIGPVPIAAKLLHVTAANDFEIPGFEDANGSLVFSITPGEPNCFAFPVIKDGEPIDIMLIGLESFDFQTVCGWPEWLGEDNLHGEVVRLHYSPLDWLAAGCTGVVQIHPFQRIHMQALQRVGRIECDDISLALEAWEWGFGASQAALSRFDVDDHPDNISAYFERQASWRIRGLELDHQFRIDAARSQVTA